MNCARAQQGTNFADLKSYTVISPPSQELHATIAADLCILLLFALCVTRRGQITLQNSDGDY